MSEHVKINSIFYLFWSLRIPLNGRQVTFLKETCNKSEKIKLKTFKKHLKLVFLEKNYFENRDESRLSDCTNFGRFQFHDFNAASGLIVLRPNSPPKVETFQLRPLVEYIKPVVMERHEFGWRDFSILGIFWHSRLAGLWHKKRT